MTGQMHARLVYSTYSAYEETISAHESVNGTKREASYSENNDA